MELLRHSKSRGQTGHTARHRREKVQAVQEAVTGAETMWVGLVMDETGKFRLGPHHRKPYTSC